MYIKSQVENLSFNSLKNQSTFNYGGMQRYNSGVTYLTGTMNKEQEVRQTNKIEVTF